MKWEIDKEFHFAAGHRVWSQVLDKPELSIETSCQCKHLHGHSYAVKVFLGADYLDQSSMVTDFKNLNFMKVFFDDILDHRFMIDINDPNFEIITGVNAAGLKSKLLDNFSLLSDVVFDEVSDQVKLHRDSFVLVDFVPTSENICKYIKWYTQSKLGNVATVTAVELWETKKSHCRYSS